MPYRDPPETFVAARVVQIAAEINELDRQIGAWCAQAPDASTAPPAVLALFARKEALTRELLALHAKHAGGRRG
jgi:hypothetical protein